MANPIINRKWKKAELYLLYWAGYLLVFTMVQGLSERDFVRVFRNELFSLAPKALFVWIVIEKLMGYLLVYRKFVRFAVIYVLLMLVFALLLRLIDNYIILKYFLTYWAREPLLSVAPFLYNLIKLQFLLTIPFCVKLFRHFNSERVRLQQLQATQNHQPKKSLYIKCERRMVSILFDDIYYMEAQGNYLEIFTVNGNFKTYLSISELEDQLPSAAFTRVHRSFIVALNKIKSHNSSEVVIGDKKIPIGRSYVGKVKNGFA